MLKKVLLVFILFVGLALATFAAEIKEIQYKNIKPGEKITVSENGNWTYAGKKSEDGFIKQVTVGTSNFSEFYLQNGEFLFSTGTNYEFIHNGSLIGYSNHDLKFYEYSMDKGILNQRELTEDEVSELFKSFRIIHISDFTSSTNSLRIKKNKSHCKIILLNDTDRYFYHYGFTSNNAKFNIYPLRGFLDITKPGMIQFSHFGDNTKDNPWFILLVK